MLASEIGMPCVCVYTTVPGIDIHAKGLRVMLVRRETGLSHPVKCFTDRSKAVLLLWIIYVISVLFLLCFCVCLFSGALLSLVGKGLTAWLSFAMPNCEVVTFPLVSWVRCGA